MSVSDVGLYKKPYHSLLNQNNIIVTGLPYVNTIADPLWHNAEQNWRKIEALLLANEKEISALIVEPIVQGAGGMLIYSQDLLKRIRRFTKEHNIHLIADEIMTGFGRTGKMLACEHAGIQPDFLCLGKALTAGWLPLSAVVTTDQIYNFFYDDYELGKSFLHSHTHAGNVLAAAVALETLKIFEAEDICEKGKIMGNYMLNAMQEIAEETQLLANVRGIGALAAADIRGARQEQRLGYQVCLRACELGAYLRPLGNTIYWLPPLNTPLAVIDQLKSITRQALLEVLRHSL
jgi:adenosylmethionine-8-amino-7-oxononanoate aminotransferase